VNLSGHGGLVVISEEDAVERYEVVVVGAGPVGLSTALFLADRGIRVLVVDRRQSLDGPPRASTSVRTMEVFRSIGLGPAVDRVAWDGPLPLRSVVKDSAVGAVQHEAGPPIRYAARLDACSPIGVRRVLTQRELQQIAVDALRRRGGQVRLGVELVDLSDEGHAVRVRVVP
jgi:tetracenomycin A2 monooxygenase-dioxygenase